MPGSNKKAAISVRWILLAFLLLLAVGYGVTYLQQQKSIDAAQQLAIIKYADACRQRILSVLETNTVTDEIPALTAEKFGKKPPVLELSGMFFILFLFMVILSEYIGKILVESRRDARYYVLDELSSTTSLANAERKNITS